MKTLLFLCTGNYYRSRFAEYYFRHLAAGQGLDWHVQSRGLELHARNVGPISRDAVRECERLGIATEPLRAPTQVELNDLVRAARIVAVKESEHRPLIRALFPDWEQRVEYWEIHDVDVEPAAEALPVLRQHVERLIGALQADACRDSARRDSA